MNSLVARTIAGVSFAVVILVLSGCSSQSEPPAEPLDLAAIENRAVTLTTTACGHASRTSGAGVIVEDGFVVTAAHVVIGAGTIEAEWTATGVDVGSATVLQLDVRNDLALLGVAGAQAEEVVLGDVEPGESISAAGGGPSGAFTARVTRRVEVRIEEVRSTVRSSRFGYEIDEAVDLGDSGGGLFNDRGDLVAIIFGRSGSRSDVSFAVRSEEIRSLVEAEDVGGWICAPGQSRIVADGQ